MNSPGKQDLARIVRQRLVGLRLTQRLTVRDAAQLSGLSRGGLEKIESGDNLPSLESLDALCAAYGTALSTFFRSVERQMSVAREVRDAWPDELLRCDELEERLTALARAAGRSETWEAARALAQIDKRDPDVAAALQSLIESLSPTSRREHRASPLPIAARRAGAHAANTGTRSANDAPEWQDERDHEESAAEDRP